MSASWRTRSNPQWLFLRARACVGSICSHAVPRRHSRPATHASVWRRKFPSRSKPTSAVHSNARSAPCRAMPPKLQGDLESVAAPSTASSRSTGYACPVRELRAVPGLVQSERSASLRATPHSCFHRAGSGRGRPPAHLEARLHRVKALASGLASVLRRSCVGLASEEGHVLSRGAPRATIAGSGG